MTRDELATAAGADVADIDRLASAGLLSAEGFSPSDVARVRLIRALEAAGVSSEQLASTIARGSLSLDFVDLLMADAVPLTHETHAGISERARLSPSLLQAVRTILGTITAAEEDPVRSDDARVMAIVERASELGANDEQLARIVRVTADVARRLVAAQRDFVDEVMIRPALQRGGSELQAVRETAEMRREYRQLGIELFQLFYERTVEAAIFQNLVELAQLGLARMGISPPASTVPPAIAFADLSGFTHMTEERGDAVAAEVASRFAGIVQEVAAIGGGKAIKLLGDGAMVEFPDARSAVTAMLGLGRRVQLEHLPPVHVGIDCGALVRRDGDVFGTVVNLASRAASHAGPGEVLVTEHVTSEWIGDDVRFAEVGTVELRGLASPVPLFRAEARSSADT